MQSFRRIRPSDILLGFLFIAIVLAGTFVYMNRERMIYSWDEANYTFLTGLTYEAFFPAHPDPPGDTFRPIYGLRNIHGSFAREYNQLFTLPLAFFERAFGTSRTVFVLGVSLLFLIPFSVFWGLVAGRIFDLPKRVAFWGTLGLILVMPATYLAVLRGFPDIGGAALLGLAVLLYLRDIELRSGWQCAAIGLVLCIMPLFRRHFMYGMSAFLVAAILQHAVLLVQTLMRDPKEGSKYFLHMAGRLIMIGLTVAALWLIFAYPFVHILVSNNYFNLYEGFMIPPTKVLSGFASAYGYVTCLLAVLGYILGYRFGVLRGAQAQFVTLLACLAALQWVFVVRQQGTHYLNHFSIYLVFGILALIATVHKTTRALPRSTLLSVIGIALAYRFVFTFGWMKAIDSPNGDGIAMAQQPPKVRADYDEVKRLISDLRRDASSG
ncbi:MAG: hypothetical protein EOO39_28580, partial [Cytophagaceae bacterium]